jgi:iron complex outermembrane recepter protein
LSQEQVIASLMEEFVPAAPVCRRHRIGSTRSPGGKQKLGLLRIAVSRCSNWRSVAGFAICLAVVPIPAQAAPREPSPERDLIGESAAVNEEITVLARRRAEKILEAPVSVTAFNAEHLQARASDDISFIDGAVPNVKLDVGTFAVASSAIPALYIRGIGQDDYLPSTDPGVGVYLDGVYLGRTIGQNLSTIDVEQVEVLRGPQGTLYGRNTIGGAVNVRLLKPRKAAGGFAQLKIGTGPLVDIAARADVPLTDRVASAWTINFRRRAGFASSRNAPEIDFGNDEKLMARSQLELSPAESLRIYVSADYLRQREESEPTFVYGSDFANPNTLVAFYNAFSPLLGRKPITSADLAPLSQPFDITQTGPSRDDFDIWGVAVTADWTISGRWSMKSITAYRGLKGHIENDQDGTRHLGALFDARIRQKQFSQEVQLTGELGPSHFVAGLYYFSEAARDDTVLSVVPGLFQALQSLPAPLIPLAPIPVDAAGQPLFGCPQVPVGFPCAGGPRNPVNVALDQTMRLFGDMQVETIAGYAQADVAIFPSISIAVGGRLTSEWKSFFAFQGKVESSRAVGSAVFNLPPRRRHADWTKFTPHLSAVYRPAAQSIFYVSYDRGFRSGTFNGRANSELSFTEVRPETVNAYEVGFKGIIRNRVRISLAAFFNDYRELQVRAVIPSTTGLDVFFVNAARARITGVEAELYYHGKGGVTLGGTFGHADSKLTRVDPFISGSTGIQSGNILPKTPRLNGSLFAQYDFVRGNGVVSLRADMNWRSDIFHDAANTELAGVGSTKEKGYALFNARISFGPPDKRWKIALWGKNLTNQVHFANLVANAGGLLAAYPVRGREFGLTWRLRL